MGGAASLALNLTQFSARLTQTVDRPDHLACNRMNLTIPVCRCHGHAFACFRKFGALRQPPDCLPNPCGPFVLDLVAPQQLQGQQVTQLLLLFSFFLFLFCFRFYREQCEKLQYALTVEPVETFRIFITDTTCQIGRQVRQQPSNAP